MLACSKQSALLSLKSISRVIQWMDQARAHATRIAQRLSPRDSTDTHRRRGREELQEHTCAYSVHMLFHLQIQHMRHMIGLHVCAQEWYESYHY